MTLRTLLTGLAAGTAVMALSAMSLWPTGGHTGQDRNAPETVRLAPITFQHRPSGNYTRTGRRADPPLERVTLPALEIMKYQVSSAEYAACVAARACSPADPSAAQARKLADAPDGAPLPQTGVSWHDATAYAEWLSRQTGQHWRLPTETEWQRAAAERFVDDATDLDGTDPAKRWLADYARNTKAREDSSAPLRQRGGYGENSLGIADLVGNVWEWTGTCVTRGRIDAEGRIAETEDYCGARIATGQHRAQIIDFVRDARAGGCGAGVPPDNLGFRLVRDRS
ncbi:formylglycine-generating enzyme family protein [Frigidibacter sp. ROC022]|uniref:formylglycine-generating enzyme family protein n=1 Tax=Frigidibacter sp. ROC022 TaxID=2971796 RepID=UPI00215A9223|nr:formylglycine-generating enzyme family protein [Frigidibacter sp. ROC022]MCR8723401.1 formylglycine-generating enzyme family protein [Frigidibacter sp. ROC022]